MTMLVGFVATFVYASFFSGTWLVFRRVRETEEMVSLDVLAFLAAVIEVAAIVTAAPQSTSLAVGLALYGSSWALFVACAYWTRECRLAPAYTKEAPTSLLSSGPWRFVRHPIYVAYLLSYVAGLVVSQNPAVLSVLLVMTAAFWEAAHNEERQLAASAFRAEWVSWRERTGMFLPVPWRAVTSMWPSKARHIASFPRTRASASSRRSR